MQIYPSSPVSTNIYTRSFAGVPEIPVGIRNEGIDGRVGEELHPYEHILQDSPQPGSREGIRFDNGDARGHDVRSFP